MFLWGEILGKILGKIFNGLSSSGVIFLHVCVQAGVWPVHKYFFKEGVLHWPGFFLWGWGFLWNFKVSCSSGERFYLEYDLWPYRDMMCRIRLQAVWNDMATGHILQIRKRKNHHRGLTYPPFPIGYWQFPIKDSTYLLSPISQSTIPWSPPAKAGGCDCLHWLIFLRGLWNLWKNFLRQFLFFSNYCWLDFSGLTPQ